MISNKTHAKADYRNKAFDNLERNIDSQRRETKITSACGNEGASAPIRLEHHLSVRFRTDFGICLIYIDASVIVAPA
jgi:hypothetical protein